MQAPEAYSPARFRFAYPLTFTILAIYAVLLNLGEFAIQGRAHWSAEDYLEYFGGSDAGSYLRLGIDLAKFTVTPEHFWIARLWPPGMALTDAAAIILPGGMFVWMLLINAASLALPVTLVLSFAKSKREFYWLGGLSILFLAQPSKFWTLTDGLFMSDGLGSNFLLSSMLLAQKGIDSYRQDKNPRRALALFAFSGFFLSVSLHYRFAFWPAALVLLIFATLMLLFSVLRAGLAAELRPLRRGIGVFIISFLLTSAPWTVVVSTIFNPGNPTWSAGDYQWAQRWMTDQYLLEGGGGYLVNGGANWACKIDTETCEALQPMVLSGDGKNYSTFQNLALETALNSPLQLLGVKIPVLAQASVTPPVGLGVALSSAGIPVFITMLILLVTPYFQIRKTLGFVYSTVVFAIFATLLVAHVESRYLIPVYDLLIFGVIFSFILSKIRDASTS
jgi:hypothetical protein